MRKSSKLLALLLTLCLMFGAITAITVFADGETATTAFPAGDSSLADTTKSLTGNSNRNGLKTAGFKDETNIRNLKYITFDADINFVDGDAATPSEIYFRSEIGNAAKIVNGNPEEKASVGCLYVVEKGSDFYLSFTNNDSNLNEKAKISNTEDVDSHLTYVLEIDNSAADKSVITPSFYVDGNFIACGDAVDFSYTEGENIYLWRFPTRGSKSGNVNWGGVTYNQKDGVFNYYNTGSDNAKALAAVIAEKAPATPEEPPVAPEAGNNVYDVTKDDANSYDLFDKAPTGFDGENTQRSKGVTYTHISDGAYVRIHKNAKAATDSTYAVGSYRYAFAKKADLHSYTHVTFDFDFAIDQYVYTWGDRTVGECFTAENDDAAKAKLKEITLPEGKTVDEIIANKELAAPDDVSFFPYLQISTNGSDWNDKTYNATNNNVAWKFEWTYRIVVYKDGGSLFAGSGASVDAAKANAIKISDEIGVYSHFTYVIEVEEVAGGCLKLTPHVYVNGEYVGSGSSLTKTSSININYARLARMNMYLYQTDTKAVADGWQKLEKYKDQYSLALDNIAVNYYTDGAFDSETPIYAKKDVVYNANYETPNKDRYATLEGDANKYYVIGAAFDKLAEGGVVTLHNVGEYQLPAGLNLNSFKVAGDFTPVETVKYDVKVEDGVYTYTLVKPYATINDGTIQYTNVEEALKLLKDGDTLNLFNIAVEGFNTELKEFKVKTDEKSTFTLAADCAWRYAKIDGTYTKVIEGKTYANLDLFHNGFRFNLYVPYVEGLKFSGATDEYLYNGGVVTIDELGGEYIKLYWNVRHDKWSKDYEAEFAYTLGETSYTFEGKLATSFDALKYATAVAEKAKCGSEEAKLIKAAVDYKIEFFKANNADRVLTAAEKEFYAVYDKHENCTCADVAPEEDYIEVGAAQNSEYKDKVTFGISDRNLYVYINAKAINEEATEVIVTYTNLYGELTTLSSIVDSASGMAAVGTISATDIDNVLSISLNNTVWEKETVDGEDVFKLDENGNKIVIKTEEVTPAFTYSLADYDASLGYEALAKALIKYAIAAENYKVIGVTK